MLNISPPRNGFTGLNLARLLGADSRSSDIIAAKGNAVRNLPHMLPSPETFANACFRLGFARNLHVVVVHCKSVFWSLRAAFAFKAFGYKKVSVLDGVLLGWKKEGGLAGETKPTHMNPDATEEPRQPTYRPIQSVLLYNKCPAVESHFIADIEEHMTEYPVPKLDKAVVRLYDQVVALTQSKDDTRDVLLDARPADRFSGANPEPRLNLSSGHAPSAVSLPFSTLLRSKDGVDTLLPKAKLEQACGKAPGKGK